MAYKNPSDQKAAASAHYRKNTAAYKSRAQKHNARQRVVLRELIREHLATHPCVDCGESDIVVLEFDHRDPSAKRFDIGNGCRIAYSVAVMRAEIEKCDVRCANCHRRKTHLERLQGKYATLVKRRAPPAGEQSRSF